MAIALPEEDKSFFLTPEFQLLVEKAGDSAEERRSPWSPEIEASSGKEC